MNTRIAVVGAGWAGMAAAVTAAERGAEVTVFEASHTLGGRARALPVHHPDGQPLLLDNGQHILIGAYTHSLAMLQRVGVPLHETLLALPLGLPFPDGSGLQTPAWASHWPAPLDALAAMATTRGWGWADRLALVKRSLAWRLNGFTCDRQASVATVCAGLPERVMADLMEPLCVSALNTPPAQASGAVFLRVLQDALFGQGHGPYAASQLLLPRTDLSALWPQAAADWLAQHHAQRVRMQLGTQVMGLHAETTGAWHLTARGHGALQGRVFDAVVWATAAGPAAQAAREAASHARQTAPSGDSPVADQLGAWAAHARALKHTAIATVYAWAPGMRLSAPMLALRSGAEAWPDGPGADPAQFVFDRGQLQPENPAAQGVLAFVISAAQGERDALQSAVLAQARRQLGMDLRPLQTVVEKRATFACTPGLQRPSAAMAPGLWAAGDYTEGPYPATLEAAVRSGVHAARRALGLAP